MNKTLITLFALALVFGSAIKVDKIAKKAIDLPFLESYATKNGVINLSNGYNNGYTVNTDFSYSYSEASDDEYDAYNMMLGLYTSNHMLSSSCGWNFDNFYCSSSSSCWTSSSYTSSVDYPYFTASGSTINTPIYLDYSNWYSGGMSVLSASSCSSNQYSSFGNSAYGILGMASTSPSTRSTVFSIYLDQNGNNGKLMFSSSSSYMSSTTSTAYLSTDANLHVNSVSSVTLGSYYIYSGSTTYNLIFDINSQYIGLPLNTYNNLLSYLSYYGVTCSSSYRTAPTCTYYGSVSSLPTITINVQSQSIPIPPSVYVSGGSTSSGTVSSITLNIQALDNSLSGSNYVTPTYQNFIILDSHVMSYYYTVFNVYSYSSSNRIGLYVANHSIFNNTNSAGAIIGVCVFIMLICCCAGASKIRNTRSALLTTVTTTNIVATKTTPIISSANTTTSPTTINLNYQAPVTYPQATVTQPAFNQATFAQPAYNQAAFVQPNYGNPYGQPGYQYNQNQYQYPQ